MKSDAGNGRRSADVSFSQSWRDKGYQLLFSMLDGMSCLSSSIAD